MKRILLCIFALALFVFTSCAKEDDFDAGKTLSGGELKELQEKLLEEKNRPQELPDDAECYFSATGSVYHKDKNCSYLKKAKEVLAGTIEEAQAAGALRPCSRCVKEAGGKE